MHRLELTAGLHGEEKKSQAALAEGEMYGIFFLLTTPNGKESIFGQTNAGSSKTADTQLPSTESDHLGQQPVSQDSGRGLCQHLLLKTLWKQTCRGLKLRHKGCCPPTSSSNGKKWCSELGRPPHLELDLHSLAGTSNSVKCV